MLVSRGRRVTSYTTPAPSTDVLTQADLIAGYLGCFTQPLTGYTATDPSFSYSALSGRIVDGQVRLFTLGSTVQGGYAYEFAPPAVFAPNLATAASGNTYRATIVTDWGNIYGSDPDVKKNSVGSACNINNGVLYHDGKLFWQFSYGYNTDSLNDRCLGMSVLDDEDPGAGNVAVYGPWRVGNGDFSNSKFCGGFATMIPQAFADAYLDGKRISLGNSFNSGGAGAPWGMTSFPIDVPTTGLAASVYNNQSSIAITPLELLQYNINARQPITIEGWTRKCCGWANPGNHSVSVGFTATGSSSIAVADTSLYAQPGSAIGATPGKFVAYIDSTGHNFFEYTGRSTSSGPGNLTGIPTSGYGAIADVLDGSGIILGNYDDGRGGVEFDPINFFGPDVEDHTFSAIYQDYVGGPVWINTGTKQCVLYLGTVADTVAGHDYGDDTVNHVWYGGINTCPHGQVDPNFQATGNAVCTSVMCGWIIDQAKFAQLAQATLDPADLVPDDYFRWNTITSAIEVLRPYGGGMSGSWFDTVNNRLYIAESSVDVVSVNPSFPLPLIHVFQL